MGSIEIEELSPSVDGGTHPAKRVAGEPVWVEVDLIQEGHGRSAGVLRWRPRLPADRPSAWSEAPLELLGNDRWHAAFIPPHPGIYEFTVEAWPDEIGTWADGLRRKVDAGLQVRGELLEGAALFRAAAGRAGVRAERSEAESVGARLLDAAELLEGGEATALATATDPALIALAASYPDRAQATRLEPPRALWVDRKRARFGAWYELFPRSAGGGTRHGTFRDVEGVLPYVAAMGFDVLYFPPIHPIGRAARKGKNNALVAQPADVGSPWAIGSSEGGHTAVHPALGTVEDFRRLVGLAAEHGLEVALDLAFQCSPDHPWIAEHPDWFPHRPDGTIRTAENPPKRYEDIVNFDFLGPSREALWTALKSVVDFWIGQGIRIFRVDNPHTKPLPFWRWLLRGVKETHPEVIFLAEAFTRPKLMRALAKLGFTQSYTYFTWRNFKGELTDYLRALSEPPSADYLRPNLWPNTPDILPEVLQRGGPPAFRIRLALAATLCPAYGIYMGYEWCENRALHGEEYLDSEKYQLKRWEIGRAGTLSAWISRVNRIRKEHRALQLDRNLCFFQADDDEVLFYGRFTPDGADPILVAVSLDPFAPREATLTVPLERLGLTEGESYEVEEQLDGGKQLWHGRTARVRLTPERPVAIWTLRRFVRQEAEFEYFGVQT